ncbi:phosphate ABC transporter permease PstA [bacterium]|nr:phosphate ABC transporter permease PstA [bacterium]
MGALLRIVCTAAAFLGVVLLVVLLWSITTLGLPWLDWQFLSSFPSRHPEKAGVLSAIFGTLWIVALTALISVPLGVGSAVYLEEYARKSRWARFLEINLSNLAGVPSILYGILGLAVFVRWFGWGRSILAGAFTLSLLVLPVIIVASREAIRTVPQGIRLSALALGVSKWQMIRHHVLPGATAGILTGVILSLSRAIGETAPLVVIGAFGYVAFLPEGPMDDFTVLPIQIFNWTARPQAEFHELAAAGILALLVVLLLMNAAAVFIRHRARRNRPW